MKSLLALTLLTVSFNGFGYVTCVPAEKKLAQNLTCIHLAKMTEKNSVVSRPFYVQTADKKLVKTNTSYHTNGNANHFFIESKARGFSVNIDFRGAEWDTTKGIQPMARVSVFDSRSHYDGKLYCSSKASMTFIRENCPALSKANEAKLLEDLENN